MAKLYSYNGYKLVALAGQGAGSLNTVFVFEDGSAAAYDPIYLATSLDLAMKWIDAYRAGEHWAIEERLGVLPV